MKPTENSTTQTKNKTIPYANIGLLVVDSLGDDDECQLWLHAIFPEALFDDVNLLGLDVRYLTLTHAIAVEDYPFGRALVGFSVPETKVLQ